MNKNSVAQNLVYNPSFEIYKQCPSNISQITTASGWYNVNLATADYFNACSKSNQTTGSVSVPNNFYGYQPAHLGNGYTGIFLRSYAMGKQRYEYKEYLQTKLNQPLTKGKKYAVEMYVSLSNNSKNAIPVISYQFSLAKINGVNNLPIISQTYRNCICKNKKYLDDTLNWMLVSDTIIAKGGERFLMIGNFQKNNSIDTLDMSPDIAAKEFFNTTYYYFDDVAVYELGKKSIQKRVEIEAMPLIYFKSNETKINKDSTYQLDQLIFIAAMSLNRFKLIGYTDSTGDKELNEKIAYQRAMEVKQYLIRKGLPKDRIVLAAITENNILKNSNAAKCRRVDYRLLPPVEKQQSDSVVIKQSAKMFQSSQELSATQFNYLMNYSFKDIYGKPIILSEIKNKMLFVDFWFLACKPCMAELPILQQLQNDFPNDFEVIIINGETTDKIDAITKMMSEKKYSFTSIKTDDKLIQKLNIHSFPTQIIIDKKGELISKKEGFDSNSDFYKKMAVLISK